MHREAATGAGAHLQVGVGHLHAFGDLGARGRLGEQQQGDQDEQRGAGSQGIRYCVLHVPVSGSAGVNIDAAALLNSSWP